MYSPTKNHLSLGQLLKSLLSMCLEAGLKHLLHILVILVTIGAPSSVPCFVFPFYSVAFHFAAAAVIVVVVVVVVCHYTHFLTATADVAKAFLFLNPILGNTLFNAQGAWLFKLHDDSINLITAFKFQTRDAYWRRTCRRRSRCRLIQDDSQRSAATETTCATRHRVETRYGETNLVLSVS
jgi:hypothetical protein